MRIGAASYKNNDIVIAIRVPSETILAEIQLLAPIPNENGEEVKIETEKIAKIGAEEYAFEEGKSIYELKRSKSCIFKGKCSLVINKEEKVVELDNNMVLLINMNNKTLNSTCDQRVLTLKGHYLVIFNNCSIQIDRFCFKNKVIGVKQKFLLPTDKRMVEVEKTVTFDEVVLKQNENIKKLKNLHYHRIVITATGSVSMSVILIVLAILIILFKRKQVAKEIKRAEPKRRSFNLRSL